MNTDRADGRISVKVLVALGYGIDIASCMCNSSTIINSSGVVI